MNSRYAPAATSVAVWNTTRRDSRTPKHVGADAKRRHGEHRHDQRVHEAARDPEIGVQPAEEQRVGEVVDVERPDRGEPQAQRLDAPARVLDGVAPELLQQHQPVDRQRQRAEEREAGRVAQRVETDQRQDLRQQRRQRQDERRGPQPAVGALPVGALARLPQQEQQQHLPRGGAQDVEAVGGQKQPRPAKRDETPVARRPQQRRHQRDDQRGAPQPGPRAGHEAHGEQRVGDRRQRVAPGGKGDGGEVQVGSRGEAGLSMRRRGGAARSRHSSAFYRLSSAAGAAWRHCRSGLLQERLQPRMPATLRICRSGVSRDQPRPPTRSRLTALLHPSTPRPCRSGFSRDRHRMPPLQSRRYTPRQPRRVNAPLRRRAPRPPSRTGRRRRGTACGS